MVQFPHNEAAAYLSVLRQIRMVMEGFSTVGKVKPRPFNTVPTDWNALRRLSREQLAILDAGLRRIRSQILTLVSTSSLSPMRSYLVDEVPSLLRRLDIPFDYQINTQGDGWTYFCNTGNPEDERITQLMKYGRYSLSEALWSSYTSYFAYESLTCLELLQQLCRWRKITK